MSIDTCLLVGLMTGVTYLLNARILSEVILSIEVHIGEADDSLKNEVALHIYLHTQLGL